MAFVTTPHINAEKDAFGRTVLMPGDPLRSKFIAENFLENAVLVNNIRGIQGYTGTYKGTKISVMASGMGMPGSTRMSFFISLMWKISCGSARRARCRRM